MKKRTVAVIAFMSSVILICGSISFVYTSINTEDVYASEESEAESCLVFLRLGSTYNNDFLDVYYAQLLSDGMAKDEAKNKTGELRKEINDTGRLSDEKLETERQNYVNDRLNKELETIYETIGIKSNDVKVDNLYDDMYILKADLSAEQIKNAESLIKYSAIVTSGNEVAKYNGKFINKVILNEVRESRAQYKITVMIKPSEEMKDEELKEFAEKIFSSIENTSVEKIGIATYGYNKVAVVTSTVNDGQLESLCANDAVIGISGISETAPVATLPVVKPTVWVEDLSFLKGDLNGDFIFDVSDLTELSLYLIGDLELKSWQTKAADVDGDGDITLADLARLQQYISKKIDTLG